MAPAAPLTICSVSFHSRPWLELNRDLTLHLNPHTELSWVVAENSPADSLLRLQSGDSRFHVVPGAAFEQRIYASGSYHHGSGMNLTLPHVKTRHVLFCDPDFFIVKMAWVHEVLEHMALHGLGVFGVPWHPRWIYKNRYFPCVHCMFVDCERVPLDWLDFRPDYETVPGHARQPEAADRPTLLGRVRRLKTPDPLKLRKRRHIGRSRDVSWRIAQRVASEPQARFECIQPVFRPHRRGLQYLIERLLPDRWCLVPKRQGYFSEMGFKEQGLTDLDGRGWEEFLWRGEPFGFHVRAQPKLKGRELMATHLAGVGEVLRRLHASA